MRTLRCGYTNGSEPNALFECSVNKILAVQGNVTLNMGGYTHTTILLQTDLPKKEKKTWLL